MHLKNILKKKKSAAVLNSKPSQQQSLSPPPSANDDVVMTIAESPHSEEPHSEEQQQQQIQPETKQQTQTFTQNQSTPQLHVPLPRSQQQHGVLTPIHTPAAEKHSPSAAPRPTKGKYNLVDFSINRTLGTGSFGRVHLVQSRHNNRFYAIKVLKKAQVVRMKQVEHTNDERAMLSMVRHPFLVCLWGTFQDSKNLFLVMDFIEGGELFSLLRKSQRFPNSVAKFYAAEVALALDYLHSLDIVYRDLKPENLLLDRNGHLKITDFGFAKRVPDITWTLCGTPDYLAPEIVSSKGYNKSVDWWSLGILTFEMLAGYPPFYDANPMKLYENILEGTVRCPPYFDVAAKDLLSKLLTADLTKRYGNLVRGSRDIMDHEWFREVNWEKLSRREIEAPYVPPVRAQGGDASCFDRYPEEEGEYGESGIDLYGALFPDW